MSIDQKIVWIWISFLGKPNYVVTDILINAFGSISDIWPDASQNHIPEVIKKHPKLYQRLTDEGLRRRAETIYDTCRRLGIRIVTVEDPVYPYNLMQVINKPPVLYYKGNLPAEAGVREDLLLSVVGSRNCTPYGRNTAFLLSRQLAQNGIGIVSGMARGIDSEAHKGALAGSGYTVAVLGNGPDVVYPRENASLYQKICTAGCVLSEFPPGMPPYKNNFPARNRIVSGLSLGTLIVEAPKSSGAMITVDRAFEQSRTVYTVPGNISSEQSAGCNELLKSQGKCVTSCNDILEDYGLADAKPLHEVCGWINGLTDAEAAVASAISNGQYEMEDIIRDTDRSAGSVAGALTTLEIKGIVSKASDGTYQLIR